MQLLSDVAITFMLAIVQLLVLYLTTQLLVKFPEGVFVHTPVECLLKLWLLLW